MILNQNMARNEFYNTLYSDKVIPLFYNDKAGRALNVVKALSDGGMRIVEFTNRGSGAITVFREIVKNFKGKIFFGAGSVTNAETAALFINEGADFIVSPVFDPETAKVCNSDKIPYIPGCYTPTEMYNAMGSGVEFIKFFPAGSVEPESLKMICGPFRKLSIIVTGGITTDENTLRKWFKNGANAFGIGSSLITKDDILKEDYETIKNKSEKLLKIMKLLEK